MKQGFAPIISVVGVLIAIGVISGIFSVTSIKPISQQNCQATLTTQITDAINKAVIPPPDRYFEIDQIKVNRECQWAIVTMTPKDMLGRPLGDSFLKSARSSEGEWEVISSENPVYGLWLRLINYLNNLLVRTSRSPDSIQPTSTPDASRESTRSTMSTTQVIAGDTSNWKTYTNTKYGFEFKYPQDWDWMKNGDFSHSPFYFHIIDYNKLQTMQEYDANPSICTLPCTKEGFIKIKNDIDNGIIPNGYTKDLMFIKIKNKNAIHILYYEFQDRKYYIKTEVYTDKGLIKLSVVLPIDPLPGTKEHPAEHINDNAKRGEKLREEILQKGLYPDEETKRIITTYNQILSTFKFVE